MTEFNVVAAEGSLGEELLIGLGMIEIHQVLVVEIETLCHEDGFQLQLPGSKARKRSNERGPGLQGEFENERPGNLNVII